MPGTNQTGLSPARTISIFFETKSAGELPVVLIRRRKVKRLQYGTKISTIRLQH
jgi:hypothetical protein